MSTTPPPPFPPPTGPLPAAPPARSPRSPWLGVAIGAVVGGVIALLVGFLVIRDDDDGDPVAAGPGTSEPAAASTTEPSTTEPDDTDPTTSEPDRPGGLSPVAEEAGAMLTEAFDTTPEEEDCMWDAFADNPELFRAIDEDAIESDPDAMLEIITLAKTCLDPDELATAFAEGMMQDADTDLSAEQADCLSEELLADDELLVTLLYLGTNPDLEPDATQLGALWQLLGSCDLGDLLAAELMGDNSEMTEAQATCVVEGMFDFDAAVVEEMWRSGVEPGYEPSDEAMTAMLELFITCDVPLTGSGSGPGDPTA